MSGSSFPASRRKKEGQALCKVVLNLEVHQHFLGGLVETDMSGSHSQSLWLCISHWLPDDAHAAVLGLTLGEPCFALFDSPVRCYCRKQRCQVSDLREGRLPGHWNSLSPRRTKQLPSWCDSLSSKKPAQPSVKAPTLSEILPSPLPLGILPVRDSSPSFVCFCLKLLFYNINFPRKTEKDYQSLICKVELNQIPFCS